MHQSIRPQVSTPMATAAIQELTHRSVISAVLDVVFRSPGSHPRRAELSSAQAVSTSRVTPARASDFAVRLKLPVRFCEELTDGPSSSLGVRVTRARSLWSHRCRTVGASGTGERHHYAGHKTTTTCSSRAGQTPWAWQPGTEKPALLRGTRVSM